MKKYIKNENSLPAIGSINDLKRTSAGVTVNGNINIDLQWGRSDTAKFAYTKILYKNRKVDIVPESTASNTIITNDGLIGVIYSIGSEKFISVVDLFESTGLIFSSILPGSSSFEMLLQYILGNNPEHKRDFIFFKDSESDYLSIRNRKIYNDSSHTYFESEMDYLTGVGYDLSIEEEYRFYKTTNSLWASKYYETENFVLLKRQFVAIEGPEDLEMEVGGNVVDFFEYPSGGLTKKIYYLGDLNISDRNSTRISFKLKTDETYGSIILY